MASPELASAPFLVLAGQLNEMIDSQRLTAHTLLPSERELAETYAVSRMTARKALALLESEGRVYRRPPRGTFVAEPRVAFRIGSFSREVRDLGMQASARLLSATLADPSVAVREALQLAAGEQAHHVRRLRLLGGEPIAIESTYYSVALTPGLIGKVPSGSLWDFIEDNYELRPRRSRATLSVVVVEGRSAQDLSVRPGSAGILQRRLTSDDTGRCIEFAEDIYRADRAAFTVEQDLS